jgi:DNA gyrase subunit A
VAAIGRVESVAIEDEMKRSYIDYAMSVIVQRALPDVRDGLKPVQRRILYAMHAMGLTAERPYRKSAVVVGDVLGHYHPHGDLAVYDALVRMAQSFSLREPLVDGHGNFGSVDGDSAAAMRYTEVRMAKITAELLKDIEKDTVDFIPNFDEKGTEPTVLPARLPNLLINGASGIAVGMATNIPPHNLGEVVDGTLLLLANPEASDAELLGLVKGPDFPTGGQILGREGIRQAFLTGRGSITIRGVATVEVAVGGKPKIVITELPYQVNKARLVEKIAELVHEKRLDGITDLRDESDRSGMRVVVECRRDVNVNVLLNKLYKYTALQQGFGVILLALVGGRPRQLSLREALLAYIEYQKQIIIRRTRYDLSRAEERAHILEGLLICIDQLDSVIALIRKAPDVPEAKAGLIAEFGLSEAQAQAVLEMRLSRLTALERQKIEDEHAALETSIAYLRAVLASDEMVRGIIESELKAVRKTFATPRRTMLVPHPGELSDEDLVADESVVVTMTHAGYVKRQPLSTYHLQKRGGRGITGMKARQEDFIEHLFVTTARRPILFFTSRGRVFKLKAYELPEAGRTARGTAIVNLLPMSADEEVTTFFPLPAELEEGGFLFMATQQGTVKKTPLSGFANIRSSGIIAIGLNEGDRLLHARATSGDRQVILVTELGHSIRFGEEDVRPTGRGAHGVRGIRLQAGDRVCGIAVPDSGQDLVVLTRRGYAKRSSLAGYRVQGRGGLGIKALGLKDKQDRVAELRAVNDNDELIVITGEGILIRFAVKDLPRQGRTATGVKAIRLDSGDQVLAVARSTPEDDPMLA